MTPTAIATPFKKLPKTFDGLCRLHPLRPVHLASEHEEATEILQSLAGFPLNRDQADYLEALSVLVHEYEQAHWARDLSHLKVAAIVQHLLDAHGMTASDLGHLLGNRALGSKILRGERELSKAHIRVLCEKFKVKADLFIAR